MDQVPRRNLEKSALSVRYADSPPLVRPLVQGGCGWPWIEQGGDGAEVQEVWEQWFLAATGGAVAGITRRAEGSGNCLPRCFGKCSASITADGMQRLSPGLHFSCRSIPRAAVLPPDPRNKCHQISLTAKTHARVVTGGSRGSLRNLFFGNFFTQVGGCVLGKSRELRTLTERRASCAERAPTDTEHGQPEQPPHALDQPSPTDLEEDVGTGDSSDNGPMRSNLALSGLEFSWDFYDGKLALDPTEFLLFQRLTKPEPRPRPIKKPQHLKRMLLECPLPHGGWNPKGEEGVKPEDVAEEDGAEPEMEEDVWGIINDQQVIQHPVHGAELFTSQACGPASPRPPCVPGFLCHHPRPVLWGGSSQTLGKTAKILAPLVPAGGSPPFCVHA